MASGGRFTIVGFFSLILALIAYWGMLHSCQRTRVSYPNVDRYAAEDDALSIPFQPVDASPPPP